MAEKISATIICFNEERLIGECIRSLGFCDEIVVIDSFSTDRTMEIVKSMGCKVVQRQYMGMNDQKEFARTQAAGPWVINIDGDEIVSEGLGKEIKTAIESGGFSAWSVPFITYIGDLRIRFGRFAGERHVRVFNKDATRYDVSIGAHDRIHTEGKTGKLYNPIFHYAYREFAIAEKKSALYSREAAQKLVEKGENISSIRRYFNPSWRFFRQYFIKLGILDGGIGYKMAMLSAREGYMKYKLAMDIKKDKT